MSEAKSKSCAKCNINRLLSEYRYRADKKWTNVVCKQCERDDNKRLRENRKKQSLIPTEGKKLCLRCNIHKNIDQFQSLDKFRPIECNSCIDCRKKDQAYYSNNTVSINNRNNEYYKVNQPDIRKHRHAYFLKNKDKYLAKQRARYNSDIEFRVAQSLRRRLRKCIGSGHTSDQLIGCDSQFLIDWLNYNLLYSQTMNWSNYGTHWHLDHVIPCKHFNLLDINQQKICFHWRNISPLEQKLNQSKSHRIDLEQIKVHNERLIEFSKLKNIEVLALDTKNMLAQPQRPLFGGNTEGKQTDVTLDIGNRPLDGKISEDDDNDFDSDIDELLLIDELDQSKSEIGNPQQVLPVTTLPFSIINIVMQLDSIKL